MSKKVLIVDDSALVRKQLSSLLDKKGFDVGVAKNGQDAIEFIQAVDFDVVTMDINMPVMDGLSALKQIMALKPTPVVMVSSLTQDEADTTFEALQYGAVDYVPKPGTFSVDIKRQEDDIVDKITSAAKISKNRLKIRKEATLKKTSLLTKKKSSKNIKKRDFSKKSGLVLIGASTGGPGLIEEIVTSLPPDYPHAVCIVQHMPANFTATFSKRLNKNSQVEVLEARASETIEAGKVIIAKGGWHLCFSKKSSGVMSAKLVLNSMNHFFCPSVDEMFKSACKIANPKDIMAVLLTGIGDDGAEGMVELKKKGAYTIGESEKSAVVYGMPKEAFERGGTCKQLDFKDIVQEILNFEVN